MLRKLLLLTLVALVFISVGVILVVTLYPQQAKEVAQKAVKGEVLIARKPPPRPTPVPSTPTPIPPPDTAKIERRLRVKPEDFPFRVANRTLQDNGQMRITLDVQNESGKNWDVAYLVLSSAYHPARVSYRLDNWRQGEVRSIDYVFPASEVRERLRELRVEDVTSVPPTGILSEGAAETSAAADGSEPKGAFGLWKDLKAVTGVQPPPPEEITKVLEESSPEAAKEIKRGTGLAFNLEGLGEIKAEPLPVNTVSGPALEIRSAYNTAITAARGAVATMKALGRTLGDQPWDEAMAPGGPGTEQLKHIRDALNLFQDKAVWIQQIHAQSPTTDTDQITKSLEQASETLLSYQQALERQVRAAHPDFQVME